MPILGFRDPNAKTKQGPTVVVQSSRLEDASFMSVLRTSYLPESAPSNTLILDREQNTLYVGTGTGIKKVVGDVKVETPEGHVDLSEYLKKNDADLKYATKEDLENKAVTPGPAGKSAYQIAKDNGFTEDEQAWLKSLNGKSAYDIALASNRFKGTEEDFVNWIKGKSAFEIAEERHGTYKGGEEEWLESLKGKSAYEIAKENLKGIRNEGEWLNSLRGKSAFEIAKENGYQGDSEAEWINSLKGEKGNDGEKGADGQPGPAGPAGPAGLTGAAGEKGEDGPMGPAGKSAYQIAKENGFAGDEQAWLNSLKGTNGENGKSAYEIAKANGYSGNSEQEWIESLKGATGPAGPAGSIGPVGPAGPAANLEDYIKRSEVEEKYVTKKAFDDLKNEFTALKAKVDANHP